MLDAKQLKTQGIRFGRSFQMAFRTALMFSSEHPSLSRPLEQSFQLLNELLKNIGQFTLGFVDNQVLLNNVLTTEPGLAQLEKEFSKRGIAALTFEPGLTLARFKNIVAVLSKPASAIEDAGGIREYLELNEIPGARIVAAARSQKSKEGDTLIQSDSEAYILSKQLAEEGPRDFMESLDSLLESACLDPTSRAAALAGLNPSDPNLAGRGYGVPIAVPNLVMDKNTEPGTNWDQDTDGDTKSATTGVNAAGGGAGGFGPGFGGRNDSFVGIGTGPGVGFGTGTAGGTGPGVPGGGPYVISQPARHGLPGSGAGEGGYGTFMELVGDSVSRSLTEERGNPRKSYLALARILKESRLDTVLAQFPESRREELQSLPPEQLAAEYIEENTLKLIARQLDQAKDRPQDRYVIEEGALRVLARSLQATHMADRLAFKLAKFFHEFSTPPHLQQKIQDELRWTVLPDKQKYARLMEKARYDFTEFRRLLDFIKDATQQREPEKVTNLVIHYFKFLEQPDVNVEAEELSRSIELIRTAKLGREPETDAIIKWLSLTLMREDVSELVHFQAANNLTILSQSAAVFEAFEKVVMVAEALRVSLMRETAKHQKCCATGMSRMLPSTSIDRLVELYIANRDANFTRIAATILRYSHPVGTDEALRHLIEEKNAANRLALLRLISQIGPTCLEHARKYLNDERWYVVRNMCNIMAELRDPELAKNLAETLKHPDARVQQAALNALTKSRTDGRAELISAALPKMAPVVQEQALDELLFLKSSGSLADLEVFVSSSSPSPFICRKALQVIANTPGPESAESMERLAHRQDLQEQIRKLALELLQRRKPN